MSSVFLKDFFPDSCWKEKSRTKKEEFVGKDYWGRSKKVAPGCHRKRRECIHILYFWATATGICLNVSLEDTENKRQCFLIVIGTCEDETIELLPYSTDTGTASSTGQNPSPLSRNEDSLKDRYLPLVMEALGSWHPCGDPRK
jgi:hypothetical protein